MKLIKENIEKILVIKFGGIGDIILSTPVLSNLKSYLPDAKIYFLTLQNARNILFDNPYIERVFTYDVTEDKGWCLIKNIRNQKYDLIIDLYSNPRTALITFLSGARYKFGFKFRGRNYAYNIKISGRGGVVHNVDFNLDALRTMEIPILNKKLDISVNIVHKEFADNFFKESGISSKPVIGISTTGGWETKRYKPDKYIKLINKLSLLYSVNFLLICGNEEERKECFYIHEKIKENTFVVPECGIRYLAALIEKCSIVIGNDSGPLHLAAAMNRPVLGIYGPTNPKLQGPFGDNNLTVVNETLNCLCCNLLKCPIGNICMTELHSDKIIIKIKELIQINKIAI